MSNDKNTSIFISDALLLYVLVLFVVCGNLQMPCSRAVGMIHVCKLIPARLLIDWFILSIYWFIPARSIHSRIKMCSKQLIQSFPLEWFIHVLNPERRARARQQRSKFLLRSSFENLTNQNHRNDVLYFSSKCTQESCLGSKEPIKNEILTWKQHMMNESFIYSFICQSDVLFRTTAPCAPRRASAWRRCV